MIIGISGKKFSGKSTIARALLHEIGPERSTCIDVGMAIKNVCLTYFDAPIISLWGTEQDKNEMIEHLGMSGRQLMQSVAEGFIKLYPNVWVNAWRNMVQTAQCHGREIIIVSDVRRENEAEAILGMGGKLIRITRAPLADPHESENGLNVWKQWHLVIPEEANEQEACELVINAVKSWGIVS